MKWIRTLGRWGSLGISVAVLGGVALTGKHWAEQHALEAVLGRGAHSDSLTLHWAYSAGCADNVCIPLSTQAETQASAQLSARRMWFTYDLPSLLRKRVILPRVIIEDAHIVSTAMQTGAKPSADHSQAGSETASQAEALAWIEQLHSHTTALENEKFFSGTQVAIDTAMLSEQWQAHFADVHKRARRIVAEAKDIQQELAGLDNPLRQEARVLASRTRLEALKRELASLKSSLLKTDKSMREQQSRIREALLAEKRALRETGLAFRSPPASQLAAQTVNGWLAACIAEPAQYSVLLSDLICSPFRHTESPRGSDIRHVDSHTAQFAAMSAKVAGDISVYGLGSSPLHRAPFTARGSFEVVARTPAGDASIGDRSRWQMLVGRSLNCISLEGESRNARAGVVHVSLESNAPGEIKAKCEVANGAASGNAQVNLQRWLGDRSHVAGVNQSLSQDSLVGQLLENALSDLELAPQEIDFAFATDGSAMRVTPEDESTQWLADQLAQAASALVAEKYDAASEELEARILAELQAVTRAVAVSHNTEMQHLQQLLQEMKTLQIEVMNNLAERAGTEFARKSVGDTLR